mgnify:FL=1
MNSVIDYKIIGTRIKNKRLELKLTQEQVSREANITTFYLSKIENGKSTTTLETLAILAKVLHVDLGYLVSGTSKIEQQYVDQRLVEISNKASESQMQLIIKISKAILDE